MFGLISKLNKAKILLLISVVFLFLMTSFTNPPSQATVDSKGMPNTLRMGIRTSAELFGEVKYSDIGDTGKRDKIEGFCKLFGEKLTAHSGVTEVTYTSITNDHLGDDYRRYAGLRPSYQVNNDTQKIDPKTRENPAIDLECGANTRFDEIATRNEDEYVNLLNGERRKPKNLRKSNLWKYNIKFEDLNDGQDSYLYTTGVKLLVNNQTYNTLIQAEKNDKLAEELENIQIAVVKNTTTLSAFKQANRDGKPSGYSYKYTGYDSRYDALDTFETNNDLNYAYASDSPILQTVLNQGFKEGYKIYPPEDDVFLPFLPKQHYGIVFYSLSGFSQQLGKVISETKKNNKKTFQTELKERLSRINQRIDALISIEYKTEAEADSLIPEEKEPTGSKKPDKQPLLSQIAAVIILVVTIISGYCFVSYVARDKGYRDQATKVLIPIVIAGVVFAVKWAFAVLFSQ